MNDGASNVGNQHSALMDLCIFSHGSNWMIASREKTRAEAAQEFQIAFSKGSVSPHLEKLFHASPMLYQQLTYQYQMLENAREVLEKLPGPVFAMMARDFKNCQDSILNVQSVAINGVDAVSLDVLNQDKRGGRNA